MTAQRSKARPLGLRLAEPSFGYLSEQDRLAQLSIPVPECQFGPLEAGDVENEQIDIAGQQFVALPLRPEIAAHGTHVEKRQLVGLTGRTIQGKGESKRRPHGYGILTGNNTVRFEKQIASTAQEIPCANWRVAAESRRIALAAAV